MGFEPMTSCMPSRRNYQAVPPALDLFTATHVDTPTNFIFFPELFRKFPLFEFDLNMDAFPSISAFDFLFLHHIMEFPNYHTYSSEKFWEKQFKKVNIQLN